MNVRADMRAKAARQGDVPPPALDDQAAQISPEIRRERAGKKPGASAGRWRDPGWKVVGVRGWLGLTKGEAAVLELRAALASRLKRCRGALAVRQLDVARSLNTSQSRVAKMEAGDPTVSLDLLVNALVLLGAGKREIALVIADWPSSPPCRRLDAAHWLSRQDW